MNCMEDAGSVGPSSGLQTVEPLPRTLLSRLKRLCSFGACLHGSSQALEADQFSLPRSRKARPNLVLCIEGGENDTTSCANNTIHASIPGREEDVVVACVGSQPLESCAHKFDHPFTVLASQPLSQVPASHASQHVSSSKLDSDAVIASPTSAANAAIWQYCHSSYAISTPYLGKPDSSRGQPQVKPTAPDSSTYIDLPDICISPGPVSPMLVLEPRRIAAPRPSSANRKTGDCTEPCAVEALPAAPSLGLNSTTSDNAPDPCKPSPKPSPVRAVPEGRPCSIWTAHPNHLRITAHPTEPRASASPERPATPLSSAAPPTHTHQVDPPPPLRNPSPAPATPHSDNHQHLFTASLWRQSGTDPGCLLDPPATRQGPLPTDVPRAPRVNTSPVIAVPVAAADAAGPLLGSTASTLTTCHHHDIMLLQQQHVLNSGATGRLWRSSVGGPLPPCRSGVAAYWDGGELPQGVYVDSSRSRHMVGGGGAAGARAPSPARSGPQDVLPQHVSCLASVSHMSVTASAVMTLPLETSSLCDVMAPQTGQVHEQTALELGSLAPALDLWAVGTQVALQIRIARGAYGVVYKGLWHGCACAVKLMLAGSVENLSSQLTEVFLCKALSCHPNIVQTFDCHVCRITGDTWNVIQQLAAASAGGSGGAGGGGGGSSSDNPAGRLMGGAASVVTNIVGGHAAALRSNTRPGSVPDLLTIAASRVSNVVPQRQGSTGASPPCTLDLSPGSLPCDSMRFGAPAHTVPAVFANAISGGTASPAAVMPTQPDSSSPAAGPAPCASPVSESACSPAAAGESLMTMYDNKSYFRSLQVAAAVACGPVAVYGSTGATAAEVVHAGSPSAALDAPAMHVGCGAPASCQDDAGTVSADSHTGGGNSQTLSASPPAVPLYDKSPLGMQSYADCAPLAVRPRILPPFPPGTAQESPSATSAPAPSSQSPSAAAASAVANLRPPEDPAASGPPTDLGHASEELGTVISLNEAAAAGLPCAVQPPPPKRRWPAESIALARGPPECAAPRSIRVLSEVTAVQLPPPPPPPQPPPSLMLPKRLSSPSLAAAAAAVAAAAVRGGGGGASQAGTKRLLDRNPPRNPPTGSGGGGGGCGSGDGGSANSALCGCRPLSSATSRGLIDGCWRTPDSFTLGGLCPGPVCRSHSQPTSPQPQSRPGGAAAASGLATAPVACFPLASAGTSSAMGFGMGMPQSPASSGHLPATREQQAGSVYASGMGSGYGSGMGSGYGTWYATGHCQQVSAGGVVAGVPGFLGRTLGPLPLLPSLHPRSAVSTGDDGDMAEAAAGARNLAQVLHQLGACEGQLVVLLVMEECDRGSLHNLLSKAATAAAAAPGPMQQHHQQQQHQHQQGGAAASGGWPGGDWRRVYSPFAGGGRYGIAAALRALVATAREVALGMAFLHVNNIIHGDLKPGNVLLRSSRQDQRGFVVKISDFGLSRVMNPVVPPPYSSLYFGMMASGDVSGGFGESGEEGSEQLGGGGDGLCSAGEEHAGLVACRCRRGGGGGGGLDGTVPYMAPEIINDNQKSKASDVWAYGVLLWQLVTGKWPYKDLLPVQIMAAVCSGEQLLTWPPEAHPELVQLGRSCLSYNPTERPSFAQIVRRLSALESDLAPR